MCDRRVLFLFVFNFFLTWCCCIEGKCGSRLEGKPSKGWPAKGRKGRLLRCVGSEGASGTAL